MPLSRQGEGAAKRRWVRQTGAGLLKSHVPVVRRKSATPRRRRADRVHQGHVVLEGYQLHQNHGGP